MVLSNSLTFCEIPVKFRENCVEKKGELSKNATFCEDLKNNLTKFRSKCKKNNFDLIEIDTVEDYKKALVGFNKKFIKS